MYQRGDDNSVHDHDLCEKKLQQFLGIFKSVVVVVDEAPESTDRFILSVPIPVSSCQI